MSVKHTELTDDLQERASLYAAGAMTGSERLEYARHLEEDRCAVCNAEVKELQSAVSLLAFAIPESSPSPRVKERLMEQARSARPVVEWPRAGIPWLQWASAAVAVASLAVAFTVSRTNNELRRLNSELTSASVRVVDLAGQGTNAQATGRIFWNWQQRRWLFYVRGLPPAPADRDYQLWFVPASGNPVSAKVFNTRPDGSYEIEIPIPDDVPGLKAAAVTTEPAGGQPQPSGPFALLGSL